MQKVVWHFVSDTGMVARAWWQTVQVPISDLREARGVDIWKVTWVIDGRPSVVSIWPPSSDTVESGQFAGTVGMGVRRDDLLRQACTRARHSDDEDHLVAINLRSGCVAQELGRKHVRYCPKLGGCPGPIKWARATPVGVCIPQVDKCLGRVVFPVMKRGEDELQLSLGIPRKRGILHESPLYSLYRSVAVFRSLWHPSKEQKQLRMLGYLDKRGINSGPGSLEIPSSFEHHCLRNARMGIGRMHT